MKKLVQINVVCNGSTGRIMCDIAKEANKKGYETYCFYGRGNADKTTNCIKFNNKLSIYFHVFLARIGFNGHGSYFATKQLVRKLKKINPDIIHLHNIHGYYINLKTLFKYLKNEYKGKVIWTLHDCWAFTGHCSHFTRVKCDKWKSECSNCSQKKEYPKTLIDTSKYEYNLKSKLFSNIENLTLVTPSVWLKNLVQNSFLKHYNIVVINNGIDKNIFRHIYDESIRIKYGIPKNKKIILGVANVWNKCKGLSYFLNLASKIDNDYIIVLVGLSPSQINKLPSNIIGIKRTNNIDDLVKIYSQSYVLYNPSLEETFSLVTAEAIACGLNVIVFDASAPREVASKRDYIVSNTLNRKVDDVNNEVLHIIRQNYLKKENNFSFYSDQCVKKYLNLY